MSVNPEYVVEKKRPLYTIVTCVVCCCQALMACKLYRGMAHEADQDDLEIEIPDEIRNYAK